MSGLIVHEWVEQAGGAEKVLDEFVKTFPSAALQVLWNDAPGRYATTALRETWLARTPLRRNKALTVPFLPFVWRQLPRRPYDWMLISSHLFAHHAQLRGSGPTVPKLVYAHTPARYIWDPNLDRRGASWPAKIASTVLRPMDRTRAQEATSIVANSKFTRARVQSSWQRDADVIYPPVDVQSIQSIDSWVDHLPARDAEIINGLPENYVLGASRFVPYKRLDLAIAAGEASGRPTVLAGSGPDEGRLRTLAAGARIPVIFIAKPSNALLYALYERADAYIFGAVEDFGIMPVEAMAVGTPVVTAGVGGTVESVIDGKTGASIHSESAADLREAVERAIKTDRNDIRKHAVKFDSARFREEVRAWVQKNA